MRFVSSRKSKWGGVWGRLVHVNTWSWSRAVEPGGRVGALAPKNFQHPKSACLSTKCPFLSKNIPALRTMLSKRTLRGSTRWPCPPPPCWSERKKKERGGKGRGLVYAATHNLPYMTFNVQKCRFDTRHFKSHTPPPPRSICFLPHFAPVPKSWLHHWHWRS